MTYDTTSVNAIVLAGGLNRIKLYPGYTPGYKALLPFREKPLIQYTLDALRRTQRVKRVGIIGPVPEIRKAVPASNGYEFLPCAESLPENLLKGLYHFRDSSIVLVTTADLPLVTSEAIEAFLEASGRTETSSGVSVLWSMVPEGDFKGHYRCAKKGFNRFSDISVCHGNLLLVTSSLVKERSFTVRMERIYEARKSSVHAALAIGPRVALSYFFAVHLFRLLSLERFAQIASAGFGLELRPVIVHDPDIAMDIDEARDFQFIMEELDRRGAR
jgi:molybdopterin-guanine dinucleotide biosynthesis protein A